MKERAARHALLAGAIVLPLVVACASARLAPTPGDVVWAATQWPGTTAADLDAGYSVYRRRCAGCHHLPLPSAHAPEKWRRTMIEMTPKARLTSAEHEIVLRYLLSIQARDEAGTPNPDSSTGGTSWRARP